MKDTKIKFQWRENKKEHEKMIDRKEFFAIFDKLAKDYAPYDNIISEELVKIIPNVDKVRIDEDFNNSQDVPIIVCFINSEHKIIKINRCHKIVWKRLHNYYE